MRLLRKRFFSRKDAKSQRIKYYKSTLCGEIKKLTFKSDLIYLFSTNTPQAPLSNLPKIADNQNLLLLIRIFRHLAGFVQPLF